MCVQHVFPSSDVRAVAHQQKAAHSNIGLQLQSRWIKHFGRATCTQTCGTDLKKKKKSGPVLTLLLPFIPSLSLLAKLSHICLLCRAACALARGSALVTLPRLSRSRGKVEAPHENCPPSSAGAQFWGADIDQWSRAPVLIV